MTSAFRFLLQALTAVLLTQLPCLTAQDADPKPEPAIIAPLAEKSLLLDIIAIDDFVVAVGERGHILVSNNGGAAWTQSPSPVRVALTAVFFLDKQKGWAVGHDATILNTDDGGKTWTVQKYAPEEDRPLLDIRFKDASKGMAIGAYGLFLSTTDGGKTWEETPINDEDDFHLNAVGVLPDGKLIIAAEAGMIYRSADDGASWQTLDSPYEGSYFGMLPTGENTALIFGLRGNCFRTEDGGDTWTQVETGTEGILNGGRVLPDGRVLVVGTGGALLLSQDGGKTFTSMPQPDRIGLSGVAWSGNKALGAGEGGIKTMSF